MTDLRQDALGLINTGNDMDMELRHLWAMEAQVKATIHLADQLSIYGEMLYTTLNGRG